MFPEFIDDQKISASCQASLNFAHGFF